MVTIVNYHVRTSTKDGRQFITLELQGEVELVQSVETGKFYATAKKCSITSTLSEDTAKALVGTKFPGSIHRVQREAYDYVIPDTGEIIKLSHSYEYSAVDATIGVEQPLRLVA